jgi:hypothetical protein
MDKTECHIVIPCQNPNPEILGQKECLNPHQAPPLENQQLPENQSKSTKIYQNLPNLPKKKNPNPEILEQNVPNKECLNPHQAPPPLENQQLPENLPESTKIYQNLPNLPNIPNIPNIPKKKRIGTICSVVGCTSRGRRDNVSFFRFPALDVYKRVSFTIKYYLWPGHLLGKTACLQLEDMSCSSTEDDSLPSARRNVVFGYPK